MSEEEGASGWMMHGKGGTRKTPNENDIFKDIKYYLVITIKVDCTS